MAVQLIFKAIVITAVMDISTKLICNILSRVVWGNFEYFEIFCQELYQDINGLNIFYILKYFEIFWNILSRVIPGNQWQGWPVDSCEWGWLLRWNDPVWSSFQFLEGMINWSCSYRSSILPVSACCLFFSHRSSDVNYHLGWIWFCSSKLYCTFVLSKK